MFTSARVACIATLVVLTCLAAFAAEKAFQRADLADAAIKFEAGSKRDAGTVTRPVATLRGEAQQALERRDFRVALQRFSQIAAVEPDQSANWLRRSYHPAGRAARGTG